MKKQMLLLLLSIVVVRNNVHANIIAELVYVNGRLETYCNRIRNINTITISADKFHYHFRGQTIEIEVFYNVIADGRIRVFHAMKCRPMYVRLLRNRRE